MTSVYCCVLKLWFHCHKIEFVTVRLKEKKEESNVKQQHKKKLVQ